MYQLQDATKGQYFGTLGVVQALDLVQRSAILRPEKVAEQIGVTPVRLICQDNFAGGETFVDIAYDRSDDHKKMRASEGVGIAWGDEFDVM